MTDDAIISLIDGKPYRTLKRHLTGRGFTPAEYRQRYGLTDNHPMIAASYATQRSQLAESIGLGAIRRKAATPSVEAASADQSAAPKPRGRRPKG